MRKTVTAIVAGTALALGCGQAMAQPLCSTITSIGAWKAAGSCDLGDKTWTIDSTSASLGDSVQTLFTLIGDVFAMQIIGFDTSASAGAWTVTYDITVTDPIKFISDMFAGADNPGGGSSLTKDVTGDPGGAFTLTVLNGVENAASEKHGLGATTLHIVETFTVSAGATLLSVSNTYLQKTRAVSTPDTLALLGLGLIALGAVRVGRRRA
jgi:hypothetical protein